MKTLTKNNLKDLTQNAVLYFENDWCAQCYSENNIVAKIEISVGDTVPFFKVDILEVPTLAKQYQVFSAPSIVLIKNGQKVDQFSKFLNQDQFEAVFKYYFGTINN